MRNIFTWILFMILPCILVTSRPVDSQRGKINEGSSRVYDYDAYNAPKPEDTSQPHDEKVISVRITSSVAVGRGKTKTNQKVSNTTVNHGVKELQSNKPSKDSITTPRNDLEEEEQEKIMTDIPPDLSGANIEFIKQLNAKKEARGLHNLEQVHPFHLNIKNQHPNDTDDSIAESSIKSIVEITDKNERFDDVIENIPLARSVPLSPPSKNYIQGLTQKPISERGNSQRLTTVSFNIVHDTPKITTNYNEPSNTHINPSQTFSNLQPYFSEPAKVYSQPAQVYSEPAKFYSEPAKVYSEPAKIYSEPAKVYSEPAKVYSEPAKFYSPPASLHLTPNVPPDNTPWQHQSQSPTLSNVINTTPITTITSTPALSNTRIAEHQPEKNYEVDEKVSIMTDGRTHGVQESSTENCKQDNCKVGYVVEGRQYRKYRVEERTSDGFIVGEYGVVRNEDGALRGVRYTADSDASPRLIYDALMKFLQLR